MKAEPVVMEQYDPPITEERVITDVRKPKSKKGWDFFIEKGLLVGFAKIAGTRIKVCKFPEEDRWWTHNPEHGDI